MMPSIRRRFRRYYAITPPRQRCRFRFRHIADYADIFDAYFSMQFFAIFSQTPHFRYAIITPPHYAADASAASFRRHAAIEARRADLTLFDDAIRCFH
jgi:hypothetical protein